jgi:hypothetical protein
MQAETAYLATLYDIVESVSDGAVLRMDMLRGILGASYPCADASEALARFIHKPELTLDLVFSQGQFQGQFQGRVNVKFPNFGLKSSQRFFVVGICVPPSE